MDFTKSNVLLDVSVNNKEELFTFVTDYAAEQGIILDKETVLKAFLEREEEFSTGLQEGFAIPHAKSAGVVKSSVIYMRTKDILEWETFDGQGIQHIFALFVPEKEAGQEHLQMISKLATALMDNPFKEQIKQTDQQSALAKIIKKEMLGENAL